jgi:hypothetical protein
MKCFNHHAVDAIAVCACCGRALCPECVPSPAPARIVCSNECAAALTRNDDAVQLLLRKSRQSARASAFYCFLSAGLSAAAAVGAWFMLPSPFLIYFTGGCAVVLFAAGFWYQRGANR